MKGQAASFLCAAVLASTAVVSSASAGNVHVLITPQSGITIGDPVRLVVEAELEPGQLVSDGDWSQRLRREWLPADLEGVEIAAIGEPTAEATATGSTWRRLVTLLVFRPGEVELPPLELAMVGDSERLVSGPISFSVDSVLPADGQADLQPPAPVLPRPLGARFWALMTFLAGAAAGVAVVAVRRGAFVSEEVRRGRQDPLTELRLALQGIDPRHPDRGHVGLSASLRRFLERRAGTPALERTTSEIYADLATMPVANGSRRQVQQILLDCDRIKFGRFTASREQLAERVRRTRDVAEEIEVHLSAWEASALTAGENPSGQEKGTA